MQFLTKKYSKISILQWEIHFSLKMVWGNEKVKKSWIFSEGVAGPPRVWQTFHLFHPWTLNHDNPSLSNWLGQASRSEFSWCGPTCLESGSETCPRALVGTILQHFLHRSRKWQREPLKQALNRVSAIRLGIASSRVAKAYWGCGILVFWTKILENSDFWQRKIKFSVKMVRGN